MATSFQALLDVSGLLASSSVAAGRPHWLDHAFPEPRDSRAHSRCQYQRKGILVMNMASFRSFARQYEGIESVYDKYLIDRGDSRVESYGSLTTPRQPRTIAQIERWRAEKP